MFRNLIGFYKLSNKKHSNLKHIYLDYITREHGILT